MPRNYYLNLKVGLYRQKGGGWWLVFPQALGSLPPQLSAVLRRKSPIPVDLEVISGHLVIIGWRGLRSKRGIKRVGATHNAKVYVPKGMIQAVPGTRAVRLKWLAGASWRFLIAVPLTGPAEPLGASDGATDSPPGSS
jgi:hypothetical protein